MDPAQFEEFLVVAVCAALSAAAVVGFFAYLVFRFFNRKKGE